MLGALVICWICSVNVFVCLSRPVGRPIVVIRIRCGFVQLSSATVTVFGKVTNLKLRLNVCVRPSTK